MGLFQKAKSWLLDDHCTGCAVKMDTAKKQLYLLPMTVGHYNSHDDPGYYEANLVPVAKKADIPTGYYACGAYIYQCPKCQKKVVKLMIFLPVRDQEKFEDTHVFEHGELVDFIENTCLEK